MTTSGAETQSRGRDDRGMAIAGICCGTVIAVGVGSIPLLDRSGPSLDPDWLRGLGLIVILMLPVILAIIGLRRPGMLLVAGIVSVPMCFMSFSFLLFPLLIPAALYLGAYGRAKVTFRPRMPPPAVAGVTLSLLVLAFLALFISDDPRCYEIVRRDDGSTVERPLPPDASSHSTSGVMSVHPTSNGIQVIGSGCSSDSVTTSEAALSLGLTVLAATSATYLSGPRRSARRSPDLYP